MVLLEDHDMLHGQLRSSVRGVAAVWKWPLVHQVAAAAGLVGLRVRQIATRRVCPWWPLGTGRRQAGSGPLRPRVRSSLGP
eukprot:4019272-Prymnesium_polylepis.1